MDTANYLDEYYYQHQMVTSQLSKPVPQFVNYSHGAFNQPSQLQKSYLSVPSASVLDSEPVQGDLHQTTAILK